MRVLHVSSGNLYGGVETMLLTLARERNLAPAMVPEFALCFEGRLSRELAACGARVHILGGVRTSRPWTVWSARRQLAALLRLEAYDAIVCHMAWPAAIFGPVVKRFGKPLLFWLHDYAQGRNWIERWAKLCRPDLAICNSHFTQTSLSNLYPGVRSEVVWCPVSAKPSPVSDAVISDAERRSIREQLGASDETAVIIQVSRMEPWKGHELHLEALAQLRGTDGWSCWIAGGAQRPEEKTYQQTLKQTADRLGIADHVRFLGQRSDVPQLLAAADIFCQPNRDPEPFGIVFIEAMTAGLPVVSCAFGGALEVIDASCGRLVAPGDAASLAACLRQMIDNPAERSLLGQAGPARAKLLTDPRQRLQQVSEIVERIVGGLAATNGTSAGQGGVTVSPAS